MSLMRCKLLSLAFAVIVAEAYAQVLQEVAQEVAATPVAAVAQPIAQYDALPAVQNNVLPVAQPVLTPVSPAEGLSTRVFKLNYASADELAQQFNYTWAADFGIASGLIRIASSFPEINAVMVTAPEYVLDVCQKVIGEVDREPPQVYIEARFIELGNTASHKIGVDWSMLDGMTGKANFGGGIDGHHVGSGVASYQTSTTTASGYTSTVLSGNTGSNGNITHFTGTLDFSEMYLTLRALESTGDARIFSNPKIIVTSGRKATVDMTTKYPNVAISAKRSNSSGVDSLDLDMQMVPIPGEDKFLFAREAFFSWGISLDVVPRISTNGLINVSIVPTISSQSDWVEAGTINSNSKSGTISAKYPIIDVQRLVTEFNMASGTTAVIGGLSRTEEQQVDNGIPGLRKIPYIGEWLFGSKVRKKVQKEILVFVTVGLVDPGNMRKDAGLPKNAVMGRQYTQGNRQEPGDRPSKRLEGLESLDMRDLDEQAQDPLRQRPEPRSTSEAVLDGIKFNIATTDGESEKEDQ